jgi:hypothetical protein
MHLPNAPANALNWTSVIIKKLYSFSIYYYVVPDRTKLLGHPLDSLRILVT